MTPNKIHRYGKGILSAVKRGRREPIPRRSRGKPVDEIIHARYDALRNWRKNTARKRKVESDIILPREVLWDIARAAPADLDALREVMSPLEWRFKAYGQEILEILSD